jgi:hypothetical protein
MKKYKNVLIIILLFTLLCPTIFRTSVTYASSNNKSISKKEVNNFKNEIEKKYGVTIVIDSNIAKDNKSAYYVLEAVSFGMDMMPKGLVQKLVKHFKTKNKKTTIKVVENLGGNYAGKYYSDTNTIQLLYGFGLDTDKILHEFGHMLGEALGHTYGTQKLKSEYTKLNGKKSYMKWKEGYEDTFVTEYSCINFSEDFAETFQSSIISPDTIQNIYIKNPKAPLVRKSELIYSLIKNQFNITPESWQIYVQKPSTKTAETLRKFKVNGYPDFTKETRYQYPITKSGFASLLEKHIERFLDQENFSWGYKLLTRKEAAKMLADILDSKKLSIGGKLLLFTDCKKLSVKEQENISKAVNAGLLSNMEGKFNPDKYLTYEQAYIVIIRLYKLLQDVKGDETD